MLFYDANGQKEEPAIEYHMDQPDVIHYKDIHVGIQESFPVITKERILDYLSCCDKTYDPKCEELYKERWE